MGYYVRISKKAVKKAKKNKRKTGVPIGKFIENAIFAYEPPEPNTLMENYLNNTL